MKKYLLLCIVGLIFIGNCEKINTKQIVSFRAETINTQLDFLLPETQKDIQDLKNKAFDFIKQKDLLKAEKLLIKLIAINPLDYKIRKVLKNVLLEQISTNFNKLSNQQLLQNKEILYKILSIDIKDTKIMNALKKIEQIKNKKFDKDKLKLAYIYLNKGYNLRDEQKLQKAICEFEKATFLVNDPELLTTFAYALRDNNQIGLARSILERALILDPMYKPANIALNKIILSEKVLNKITNNTDITSLKERVEAFITLGEYKQAQIDIKKMSLISDSEDINILLSKIYTKIGKYHKAVEELNKAFSKSKWRKIFKNYNILIYKSQLEDLKSIELIGLKFRTDPELIRIINNLKDSETIEEYQMFFIPILKTNRNFIFPVREPNYVSSLFGYRLSPINGNWEFHSGIDIETLEGTPALSIDDGKIIYSGKRGGYGNSIIIEHKKGIISTYNHADRLLLKKDSKVKKSQKVIITGNTGASVSNHIHFEIKVNNKFENPLDWL